MLITGMLVSDKAPLNILWEKNRDLQFTKGYACKRNMLVSDMLVSGMQCILYSLINSTVSTWDYPFIFLGLCGVLVHMYQQQLSLSRRMGLMQAGGIWPNLVPKNPASKVTPLTPRANPETPGLRRYDGFLPPKKAHNSPCLGRGSKIKQMRVENVICMLKKAKNLQEIYRLPPC